MADLLESLPEYAPSATDENNRELELVEQLFGGGGTGGGGGSGGGGGGGCRSTTKAAVSRRDLIVRAGLGSVLFAVLASPNVDGVLRQWIKNEYARVAVKTVLFAVLFVTVYSFA